MDTAAPYKADAPLRVLLIEDDEVDALAFARKVAADQLPYQTHIARSLADTRNLLATQSFDIILADNDLPDGSSLELLDGNLDTPVIIITGVGNEQIAVAALRAGARDYLIKDAERRYLAVLPHRINQLMRVVSAEQRRRESED